MLLEMKIPSPGESISEVEIIEWLVDNGEYVEKDQIIAEIDSDKATLELPAEESGVIKILVNEGTIVAVGEVVCIIDTNQKNLSKKKEENKKEKKNLNKDKKEETKVFSHKTTPLAKAIIEDNSILDKELTYKDKNKKIKKEDVMPLIQEAKIDGARGVTRNKLSTIRKKIASRLVGVKNEAAILTTFNEVDMSEIIRLRNQFKESFKKKYKVNLGFMSFFTKASSIALMEFKNVNAILDQDYVIYHKYTDIGIAVSAPKGLMVPVLRNTELMNFSQIELEIKRLAIKAREGKISIQDMLGGTFTITNGGVFGSMLSTPIINPPQSAILGMHNIIDRAIIIEGDIKVRPIMYLALSYDHRIIDGKDSVQFLCRIKEYLEDPVGKLLNNNPKKYLGI